jgi:hypothetical protein
MQALRVVAWWSDVGVRGKGGTSLAPGQQQRQGRRMACATAPRTRRLPKGSGAWGVGRLLLALVRALITPGLVRGMAPNSAVRAPIVWAFMHATAPACACGFQRGMLPLFSAGAVLVV